MKSALATATIIATTAAYRSELDFSFESGEVVKTPQPHEYMSASELPESLDYRAMGLLTSDLNQHIPVYCGSWYD
jgi:cathepsin X